MNGITRLPESISAYLCVCQCSWSQRLIRWAYGVMSEKGLPVMGNRNKLTKHSGCWITARRFYLSAFNTPRWVEHTKTRTTYLRISEICFIGPQRFYAVFKKVENNFNLSFNLFLIYRQEVSERDGPVTVGRCAGAVRWEWFFLGSVRDLSMLWPGGQSEPLVIKWRHINSWNVSRYQSVQ